MQMARSILGRGFDSRRLHHLSCSAVYRYLEARHVRAIIAGAGQQVTRRLQGLFHNKFIRRYVPRLRARLVLDPGLPLLAYGLELRGPRALQAYRARIAAVSREGPELVRWRKEYTRRTEWFLEQHLMVSNCHGLLELALRETVDTDLLRWDQGQDGWLSVPDPRDRGRSLRVAPDAQFSIRSCEPRTSTANTRRIKSAQA